MQSRLRSRAGRLALSMVAAATLAAVLVPVLGTAAMAAYPERPIKIIVPFAPGGANDLIARILGVPLGQALGQSVIIENRGGANGNIGIAAAARAEPDGYTLLVSSNVFEVNPALAKQATYDPLKDFAAISDLVAAPNVIAARSDTGLKSFADLVARARARPGELNFATPGTGSISHLGAELLKIRADIGMTHVPFTGAGPALQAVLGGTVGLIGVTVSTAVPHHKSGALVALVQTGKERWVDLPDVPTLAEAGVPNSDSETLQSLYAPAGAPKAILDRLAKEVADVLKRPEVREQLAKANFRVLGAGPQAQQARLAKDVATWKEVITKAGIKVD
jgi:tripartite-type tricarboxylate transporter receptor subunit TctC